MGSGSFGGGGGGVIRAGSGGTGAIGGGGGYRFKKDKVISTKPLVSKTEKIVKETLAKLPREYALKMFGSPMVRGLYEDLFELAVHIFQNRSWQGLEERYGVPGGPGCLLAWAQSVIARRRSEEPNFKISETAGLALEDFLMAALGNEIDRYVSGDTTEILEHLDKNRFDSTSSYFLAFLIKRTLAREPSFATVPEGTEAQISQIAEQTADRIVRSFESKFYGKQQTTHRDLFRLIQEQPDWFLEQLRK
jgi:hypothetical protein